MSEKKKILFYTYLSSGHLNVCSKIATILLDNHGNEIEIYFLADELWVEKLSKIDSRFKFEIYQQSKKKEEGLFHKTVQKLEDCLKLPYNERNIEAFKIFYDNVDNLYFTEKQITEIIKNLKPNFILCDMITQMPSVISSKIPYSFIISGNPLIFDFEDFPPNGLYLSTKDKEKIRSSRLHVEKVLESSKNEFKKIFDKMNVKYDKKYSVFVPISDHFSFYSYPKELDYYNDEIRKKYKLLQVDSPLVTSKIPKPYELPKNFAELPGKIFYVSLGSLFSCYHTKLQKLLDALATLPYKYIVSKGPNGDKIKFPDNRFIGENFIDQLAVLQVVDMMIAHGGNNTLTECFYFGVPSIIIPVMFDQINNAMRIEETGFGYHLNLMDYTREELKDKINKILSDVTLIEKIKKIGERIRKENSLNIAVEKFYEYFLSLDKS